MLREMIIAYKTGNIQIAISTPQRPRRRRKKNYCWQEEPYHLALEEESLWKAVITQAVVDACSRDPRPEYVERKEEAILWLTSGSDDFADVCIRAGLEPSRVRQQAKKALLHPSLWRAEPGKGWRYEKRRAVRLRRKKERRAKRALPAPVPGCLVVYPFH